MQRFFSQIVKYRSNESLRSKWLEAALCLFAALLPFQSEIFHVTYAILLYGVIWAFWLNPKTYFQQLKSSKPFLLASLYFVWLMLGTTYSDLPEDGWRLVVLRVTLWLWPLGLVSMGGLSPASIRKILSTFLHAVSLSALYSIGLALYDFVVFEHAEAFFYKNLVFNEMIPSHYYALYLSFGILIAIDALMKGMKSNGMKLLVGMEVALLLSTLAMLSVRIQFVGLPLALLVYVVFNNVKSKHKIPWKYVAIALVVIATGVLSFSGPRKRISETFDEVASMRGVVNQKQTNHRVFIWKYGLESILEAPILGHGTGEADEVLFQKLKTCDAKFWKGTTPYYLWEMRYNYHNAYLQEWASNGIVGLILFVLLLWIGIAKSFARKHYLALAWMAACLVSFTTESMLDRQAGVLFFGFFYWVFTLNTGADKTTSMSEKSTTA